MKIVWEPMFYGLNISMKVFLRKIYFLIGSFFNFRTAMFVSFQASKLNSFE